MMFRNRSKVTWIAIVALCVAAVSTTRAQAPPPITTLKTVVPLRVLITMSRFQGERKLASVPFEFIVNANELRQQIGPTSVPGDLISNYLKTTSVRVGVNVPAGTETTTSSQDVTTSRPSYRYVGTSIDCSAMSEEDGRLRLYISIDDSSIFTSDPAAPGAFRIGEAAAFRSLTTSNRVSVKDGQTVALVSVTDRLSGDLVKVEVTATVMK